MDPKLFIPSQHALRRRTFPVLKLWALLAVWLVLAQTTFADHKQQRSEEKEGSRGSTQTAFVYQGQLKDEGIPSTGSHGFRFTLYTAQTDGDESEPGEIIRTDLVGLKQGGKLFGHVGSYCNQRGCRRESPPVVFVLG